MPWVRLNTATASSVPNTVTAPPPMSVHRAPNTSPIQPTIGAPSGVPPMKIIM